MTHYVFMWYPGFSVGGIVRHLKLKQFYTLFVDYTKAFDYVVREYLWYKLIPLGLRDYIALMPQSTTQSHSVSASASTATTTSSTKRSTSSTRASTSSIQTSTSLTTTNGGDHCLSNPCMAGRCSVLNNSFKCTCYPGCSGQFQQFYNLYQGSSTLTTKAARKPRQRQLYETHVCRTHVGWVVFHVLHNISFVSVFTDIGEANFVSGQQKANVYLDPDLYTAPTTTVTDFCTPSPCFAGNCSLYLNTYRCTCNYGYTGRNCSINYIALMPQSTKQSHSVSASASTATTTSSTKRSTTSSTRASTSSTQTSTSLTTTNGVDHCLSNPCMAGRCSVLNNSFKCTCYPGYSGTQCSQVVAASFSSSTTYTKRSSTLTTKASTQAQTTAIVRDPCMSNPCMAGLCSMYYTTYRCECFYGYWGSQCEKRWAAVDTDVCSLQPCVHGICTELNQTAFHCNCEKGYTGKTCNDSLTLTTAAYVDICDLNPCGKGNCTRIDNQTFKCSCPLGYTGRTCSIKQDCPSLKIGDHVVRGPDWKWGAQGISRIGTVVSVPRKGWAMVSWAEKEANYYRNGAENACDVWLYNATTASSLVTTNSSCDDHKKLCQAHCSPYGYMMDADVCDFCLCNHANHGV
ncbi:neurogenic locus notch homolog protein 1-like [Mercenaria mercenaria]|uniref:neurogenic locus notch homolog protein 1-like n=1 Tax=Mercenaria mercenaria TaxID=6596 RepID=UPI00234F12BF|nr:neurogenic locus notch homolog protein 1-like [Mercenaria mercenaria]